MNQQGPIVLETAGARLGFQPRSGRLISFRSRQAPQQQFIAAAAAHPVFVIQYLDDRREYGRLDSFDAAETDIRCEPSSHGQILTMHFSGIGGLDLSLTGTVRASADEVLSRWSISLSNAAGLEVVDVQFPFVVAAYAPGEEPAGEALLLPHGTGRLIAVPQPSDLAPDDTEAWEFRPENGDTHHYPGAVFAQFMAYYNDAAGVYLACDDTEGNVKLLKALHREPGIRLGVAHVGEWPRSGTRQLEYDVLLGSFTGDWHAAAEIYRSWSLKQKWATPLHQRADVPEWLLDSPPHITLRLQGLLDAGPVFPVEPFLPYEKSIPFLEKVAERVEAPLVAVIMSWERGGPWVYPDCFPPVGGDESVTRFAAMARQHGWHVGSFCNGTRWVTGHKWNGYDGREYFAQHHGEASVCRTHTGEPWTESWDASWRPSYACCMGVEVTRDIAVDFVQRLIGWGLESIQFFDQNVNASTFPCFAADHDHPPVPGKWMVQRMQQMIGAFEALAREAGEVGVIQSVECPCNEYCLPLFQQSDVRVSPPSSIGDPHFVPVYHYLFHECMIMHGMMGYGPEPYHLPIRNALNGVLGEIPGAVMTGDGTLLNKDTGNWAAWQPPVGSDDDALEMIRTITAMRRGPGREFLVFGRMQPPASIDGIETVRWQYDGRDREVPAVFHAAWQSPAGALGIVMANWTTHEQTVTIVDPRLGQQATVHTAGSTLISETIRITDDATTVPLPPLTCVLVEVDS